MSSPGSRFYMIAGVALPCGLQATQVLPYFLHTHRTLAHDSVIFLYETIFIYMYVGFID